MSLEAVRRAGTAIGTITPSGNIVVERVTTAVLADFPAVSGHFSRTTVVGGGDAEAETYDWDGMLRAAELLGHAAPAALVWNGSKGGSLGFGADLELCRRIRATTGIAATTSTLAIDAAMRDRGERRVALVTPYSAGYAARIPPHFLAAGYTVVGEAHAGLVDNLSYASVPDAEILAMARGVAASGPDAIIAYCTNLPAAHLVGSLEAELGFSVYDSTSAGVWGALRLAGLATAAGRRWGSLFGRDLPL